MWFLLRKGVGHRILGGGSGGGSAGAEVLPLSMHSRSELESGREFQIRIRECTNLKENRDYELDFFSHLYLSYSGGTSSLARPHRGVRG